MGVTDEELGAFLDGECSDADAARIAALIENDPGLALRLDAMRADMLLLRTAFDAVRDEPVPARLAAAVVPPTADVIDFAAARAARPAPRRWLPGLAMAASIAFGVIVGALGFNRPGDGNNLVLAAGDGPVAGPALAATLASARSGTTASAGAAAVKPLLSFRDSDGRLCRQFDLMQDATITGGVACRTGDDWRLLVLATRPAAASGAYVTAAGQADAAIAATIDGIIAGAPLDAVAEARALAARP